MAKKRVSISFDFDKDLALKNLRVGQAKKPDSPFGISDRSLKEAVPMNHWESQAKGKITMSDIVYNAPGIREEAKNNANR